MSEALTTYLQDHMAGAMHAVELLKAMCNHHGGEPLGQFASELLSEIEADRNLLAGLIEKAGANPGRMKNWGAWLGEKVSRLKLKHGHGDGLGTFKALEFLVVGTLGKWRCGAHCPSLQFAIPDSRVPILRSLRCALKSARQSRHTKT